MGYETGTLSVVTTALAAIQEIAMEAYVEAQKWTRRPIYEAAWSNGLASETPFGQNYISWVNGPSTSARQTLGTAITTTDETDIDVNSIERVMPNQVIQIDDEQMLVVSVDYDTGLATVSRGFASTTAATHLINATVRILPQTPPDGADIGDGNTVYGAATSNYGLRMEKAYHFTEEAENLPRTRNEATLAVQIPRMMGEMGDEFVEALWVGKATATTNTRRTMNGFRAMITTNTASAGGALYASHIETGISNCLTQSGIAPDTLWVNSTLDPSFSTWGGALIATTDYTGQYGGSLQVYRSKMNGVDPLVVRVDETLDSDEILIGNSAMLHAGWLNVYGNQFYRDFPNQPEFPGISFLVQQTGRTIKVQMLGMACCQVRNEKAFHLISGATSVDADATA